MADKKKGKLDQILSKLEEHDRRFDNHDKRFDKIESSLSKQATKFLEVDDKLGRIDAKIDSKFNQVLTGQDKVMGELERAREDRKLAKKKDDEQDQQLDGLDKRVKVLEGSRP